MRIRYSREREKLEIFIEEELWKVVSTTIFGRRPLFPKTCESKELFSVEFEKLHYQKAKAYALRRLGQQSYRSEALKKILLDKFVAEATAKRIVQELVDLGYIDDKAWTESFIRRHQNRCDGPKKIVMKLRQKGLSTEEVDNATLSFSNEEVLEEQIKRLLETRYARYKLDDFKEKQKVVAALARRGYNYSLISRTLNFYEQEL